MNAQQQSITAAHTSGTCTTDGRSCDCATAYAAAAAAPSLSRSTGQTSHVNGTRHFWAADSDSDVRADISVITFGGTGRMSIMATGDGESREVVLSEADARMLLTMLHEHYGA